MNENKNTREKRNTTTVVSQYTFLILLVSVTIYIMNYPDRADNLKILLNRVIELNIYTFLSVLFGAGAFGKLIVLFNKYRGKND